MQENERKEMALLQYMCVSHSVMSNSLPSQAMPGTSVSGILQARILEWVTVYKQLLICFITLSHLHQVSLSVTSAQTEHTAHAFAGMGHGKQVLHLYKRSGLTAGGGPLCCELWGLYKADFKSSVERSSYK